VTGLPMDSTQKLSLNGIKRNKRIVRDSHLLLLALLVTVVSIKELLALYSYQTCHM
jgi:hypothetical protein